MYVPNLYVQYCMGAPRCLGLGCPPERQVSKSMPLSFYLFALTSIKIMIGSVLHVHLSYMSMNDMKKNYHIFPNVSLLKRDAQCG